jgi:transposase
MAETFGSATAWAGIWGRGDVTVGSVSCLPLVYGAAALVIEGRRRSLMMWTAPHKASRCHRVIVDDESPERGRPRQQLPTIGIDLAKKVFQVHGVDAEGKVVVAQKLRRKEVLAFFAKLLGGMSAKQAAIAIAKAWGNVPASPQLHHG